MIPALEEHIYSSFQSNFISYILPQVNEEFGPGRKYELFINIGKMKS
jgi:hypothetical protein